MQVETSLHNHDVTMISMTVTDSDGTIEKVMELAERPMNEMYVEIKYLEYGGSFSGKYSNNDICTFFYKCMSFSSIFFSKGGASRKACGIKPMRTGKSCPHTA